MKLSFSIICKRIFIRILRTFVVVYFLASLASCNSTKFAAVPCPDLPLNSNYSPQKKPKNNKLFAFSKNNTTRYRASKKKIKSRSGTSKEKVLIIENTGLKNNEYITNQPDLLSGRVDIQLDETSDRKKDEFVPISYPNYPEVRSEIVGTASTKYLAPEVLNVKKLNADRSLSTNIHAVQQTDMPKIEGLGLAGFISGLVGLLILPLPLGIIATVFGAISLAKYNKNPGKYRGKGFAITSLVVGIVDIAWVLILVAAIL